MLVDVSKWKRVNGASEGIRTLDLRFTKPMLYQLSYAGLLRSDLENSRGFFSLSSFPAFGPQSHQDSLITNTHPYCSTLHSRECPFSTNKATQLSLNQTQLQS